jgi:hypothetical protein
MLCANPKAAVERQRIGKYPQIAQITQIFCFSFLAHRRGTEYFYPSDEPSWSAKACRSSNKKLLDYQFPFARQSLEAPTV